MKTYLSIATILTASLGITNLAMAHGGGGGFGGGGGHFGGGGGMHFSAPPAMGHFSAPAPVAHFSAPAPAAHFSAPAAAGHFSPPLAAGQFAVREGRGSVSGGRDDRGRHDHDRDRDFHRRFLLGGDWPYYYGDSGYWSSDDSTPYYSGSDSTVVVVQKALARDGYYHGPIDGTLDLITQDAIAKYDRDHHLPVTHTINRPLLSSLRVG